MCIEEYMCIHEEQSSTLRSDLVVQPPGFRQKMLRRRTLESQEDPAKFIRRFDEDGSQWSDLISEDWAQFSMSPVHVFVQFLRTASHHQGQHRT